MLVVCRAATRVDHSAAPNAANPEGASAEASALSGFAMLVPPCGFPSTRPFRHVRPPEGFWSVRSCERSPALAGGRSFRNTGCPCGPPARPFRARPPGRFPFPVTMSMYIPQNPAVKPRSILCFREPKITPPQDENHGPRLTQKRPRGGSASFRPLRSRGRRPVHRPGRTHRRGAAPTRLRRNRNAAANRI